MKILIVEDEEKLRNSLAEGLRLKGYAIDVAGDGECADEKALYERYDSGPESTQDRWVFCTRKFS